MQTPKVDIVSRLKLTELISVYDNLVLSDAKTCQIRTALNLTDRFTKQIMDVPLGDQW
jgi:predicted transposase YbfD/YdcC